MRASEEKYMRASEESSAVSRKYLSMPLNSNVLERLCSLGFKQPSLKISHFSRPMIEEKVEIDHT